MSIAALALLCAVLLPTARGDAAPVSYYPLPGSSDQWIEDLTADGDGSLWVTQSLSEGPNMSEQHTRLLHLGPTGNLLAATEPVEGNPYSSKLAPADHGGAWQLAYGSGLRHIDADGNVQAIALPAKGVNPDTLAAGQDGRAWAALCEFVFGEPQEERCNAVAATPGGEVAEVPLPAISTTWPPGAHSAGGYLGSVATSTGVWFWKSWSFEGSAPTTSAAFVSYSGKATKVDVPTSSRPAAPGPGDSVWWIQSEGKGGATMGRTSATGIVSDVHHIGNVSEIDPADPFVGDPGRNGNLLWAQNATWSESYDGQVGVAHPDGSIAEYKVEKDATTVPTSIPDFWSGSCTFGVRLYEAIDGGIWTISGGHPSRLTRQQPSGAFETYLLGGGASEFANEKETGVWGMVETDPRSLYFSLNTPTGPELARLDPLDPPPAEPRFPHVGAVAYGRPTTVRIQRLLSSLIRQTRHALPRLERGAKKVRLRANFPERGTASVVLRRPHHKPLLLSATASGFPGPHSLHLRLRRAGRALLRAGAHKRAVLTATFTPADGTPVHRTGKFAL